MSILNLFCIKCGTKLPGDALFCIRCGTAVNPLNNDDNGNSEPSQLSTTPHDEVTDNPTINNGSLFPEPEVFDETLSPALHLERDLNFSELSIGDKISPTNPSEPPKPLTTVIAEKPAPQNIQRNKGSSKSLKAYMATESTLKPHTAIITVIACLILFLSITIGQTWFALKNGIDGGSVKAAANTIFGETKLSTLPIFEVIPTSFGIFPEGGYYDEDALLGEIIYDSIDDYYKNKFGIEQIHINQILEDELFSDSLNKIIDSYIGYITGDESISDNDNNNIISSSEVSMLISNNKDRIEDITSYKLTERDIKNIEKALDESGINSLTWDVISNETNEVREVFEKINSYNSEITISIIAFIALIIAIIAIINRKRLSNVMVCIAIPCLISGVLFITLRIIRVDLLLEIITLNLNIEIGEIRTVINAILPSLGNFIMFSGMITLGIGFVLIGMRVIFAKRFSKGYNR